MKKLFVVLFVFSFLFVGCSPKDEVKDGTHLDDGVVYVEDMTNDLYTIN